MLLAAAEKVFELPLVTGLWLTTHDADKGRTRGTRRMHASSSLQTGLGAGSTRASYNFKVLPFVVTTPREQQNDERNKTD